MLEWEWTKDFPLMGEGLGQGTNKCHYYLDGQCAYWSAKRKLPKCDKNTPFCNKNFKEGIKNERA